MPAREYNKSAPSRKEDPRLAKDAQKKAAYKEQKAKERNKLAKEPSKSAKKKPRRGDKGGPDRMVPLGKPAKGKNSLKIKRGRK